jgi:hypothetical protein
MIGLGVVHALVVGLADWDANDRGMRFLNLDADQSLISFYSGALILVAALTTLGLGLCHRRIGSDQARYWLMLAAVLLYMSMDEMISFHETTGHVLWRRGVVPDSLLFANWLVFGIPVALAVGLLFLRFLRMIERPLAARFILAGGIFLGGAIGMELIANLLYIRQAPTGLYLLETVLEEGSELIGMTLYAVTVLGRLRIAVEAHPA